MKIYRFDTRWVADDHATFIAAAGDKTVGTVMVDFTNDGTGRAMLWNLQVSEGYRGQGIGKQLLKAAMNAARGRELHLVWRRIDSPEWIHQWYERNGFEDCAFGKGVIEMKQLVK